MTRSQKPARLQDPAEDRPWSPRSARSRGFSVIRRLTMSRDDSGGLHVPESIEFRREEAKHGVENDALLRIIQGFGEEFEQRESGAIRSPGRRAEAFRLASAASYSAVQSVCVWVLLLVCTALAVSGARTQRDAAVVVLAATIMLGLYLPCRNAIETTLNRVCVRARARGNSDEELAWLRTGSVALGLLLLLVTVVWGWGVGLVVGAGSSDPRVTLRADKFARFGIVAAAPDLMTSLLHAAIGGRAVVAADAGAGSILTPLLTIILLNQGMGLEALPVSAALAGLARLVALTVFVYLNPPRTNRQSSSDPSSEQAQLEQDSTSQLRDPSVVDFLRVSGTCAAQELFRVGPDVALFGLAAMLGWTAVTAHAWLFCTCRVIIALSGQPAVSAAVEGRSLHLLEYEGSATRALGVLRLGWTMTLPLTALGSVILIAVSLISAGGVPGGPGASSLVAVCCIVRVAALGLGGWMRARRDAYCAGAAGAGAAWASVFISYMFAVVVGWNVTGLWLGIAVSHTSALVICIARDATSLRVCTWIRSCAQPSPGSPRGRYKLAHSSESSPTGSDDRAAIRLRTM